MSASEKDPEGRGASEDSSPPDTTEKSGRDRRRAQRILLDLEVDYRCEDTFLFAYITDMSAFGIFVRTNNPEPPGTNLNLRFTLPGDEEPLEVEGEVIWINTFRPGDFSSLHPGMGVRFLDLSLEERDRLVALIKKIAYLEETDDCGLNEDAAQVGEAVDAPSQAAAADAARAAWDGDEEQQDDLSAVQLKDGNSGRGDGTGRH